MLWYVSLQEIKSKLINANNYGYGLDIRKIKKGLPTKELTVQRHKEEYEFFLDLYVYKLLRDEGHHPPLWTMSPRWEQEIAYDFWTAYLSYSWQGAKSKNSGRKNLNV